MGAVLSFIRASLPLVLVVFVAAFLTFHPYLDEAGFCGAGGCPEASQSSHASHAGTSAGFSAACLVAVLVASGARALGFVGSSGRLLVADHRRPPEAYLSLDTPPPKLLPGR